MNRTAIRAHGISKQYRIGPNRQWPTNTLRDTITHAATRSIRKVRSTLRGASPIQAPTGHVPTIWALDGISFEIKRGEVVGIIGPNGAGKSTLLKILSRITEPTRGYGDIFGRVGSLLEVGLGFHGELTGRENMYLSGAMLGMRKAEIERKFDAIIEFSEVGKFIDTPTKFYSTGMHMRLAFAVAVHLEPDILLVDEVLAVGDLSFQRKCLRKMEHVASHGRTVLFVSHNLAAMQELCESAIVLIDGKLSFRGPIRDGVSCYSQTMVSAESESLSMDAPTHWSQVSIDGYRKGVVVPIAGGTPFDAVGSLVLAAPVHKARFLCTLENARGETVLDQAVDHEELGGTFLDAGLHQVKVQFPSLWLAPGLYTLHFKLAGSAQGELLWSPPAMINVHGGLGSAGAGILSAPLKWVVAPRASVAQELVT